MATAPQPKTIPAIHVDSLSEDPISVGFPWDLTPKSGYSLPNIPDMTEVDPSSLTQVMKGPDGRVLQGLPVTVISQTSSLLRAAYVFRTADLPTGKKTGNYKAHIHGKTRGGIPFRTGEAILPVVDEFSK